VSIHKIFRLRETKIHNTSGFYSLEKCLAFFADVYRSTDWREMPKTFQSRDPKGKAHLGDLDVFGRVILKYSGPSNFNGLMFEQLETPTKNSRKIRF
jgi:hypothetical protein